MFWALYVVCRETCRAIGACFRAVGDIVNVLAGGGRR